MGLILITPLFWTMLKKTARSVFLGIPKLQLSQLSLLQLRNYFQKHSISKWRKMDISRQWSKCLQVQRNWCREFCRRGGERGPGANSFVTGKIGQAVRWRHDVGQMQSNYVCWAAKYKNTGEYKYKYLAVTLSLTCWKWPCDLRDVTQATEDPNFL